MRPGDRGLRSAAIHADLRIFDFAVGVGVELSFRQTEERGAPPDKAAFVRRLRDLLSTAPEWGGRGHDRTPVLKELSQLLDQATRLWPEDEKIQLEILWTRAVTMKLAPSASKS